MNKTQWLALAPALALLAGLVLVTPALAGTAPRGPNLDGGVILGPLSDAPEGDPVNWIDHFDTYATGMQLHAVGGWEGWANSPASGAQTSSTEARTAPNSVEILGASDLVHPETDYTDGKWTFSAWQYIPSGYTGQSYFIMLNTYSNDPGCTGCNWSVQVQFDSTSGMMLNEGASGGTMPFVLDKWNEIRVEIDLDADTQTFYYNGLPLYTGTWSQEVSGGGITSIATVDLFANGATSVYYDDISLSSLPFSDGFESGDTREWHFTLP